MSPSPQSRQSKEWELIRARYMNHSPEKKQPANQERQQQEQAHKGHLSLRILI